MKGVRGFNDRTALPLRNGLNSFYQPISDSNLTEYMLPFRVDSHSTDAICMPAPCMGYTCDIDIYNKGRHDRWNTARDPGMGMAYFNREDLPYYYTLYDNFATGDQYFQSTFTATNPNRMFLFSGSNGLSVDEKAVLDNYEPKPGYTWNTMGEVLEESGISWRVYQQIDNFDDNAFAWFANYHNSRPGDPLFDKGMARTFSAIETFEDDVVSGSLPAVSWVIAPTHRSEHATHHPSAGEDFTARLLKVLEENPEVYAKTAFILNYDEGGQFWDHAWAPTPPMPGYGISTVTVEGEVNSEVETKVNAPIGMGFRVPLLIVSPWTRGNIVVSQVFDHTSVIQFVEQRFNVSTNVISPWRRTVAGNLLSAFDFDHPDYSWPVLPDTSDYVRQSIEQCRTLPPPQIPEEQSFPLQETGTRISRSLPYEFIISDSVIKSESLSVSIDVTIRNTGTAGAAFLLLDKVNLDVADPRHYTVESGKSIVDHLSLAVLDGTSAIYRATLVGPNGFLRSFEGDSKNNDCVGASSYINYNMESNTLVVNLLNENSVNSLSFLVTDNVYSIFEPKNIDVKAGRSVAVEVDMSAVGHWYDITISVGATNICYSRRSMGRMETGKDTISDPAMAFGAPAVGVDKFPIEHPKIPESLRTVSRDFIAIENSNKDSLIYTDKIDL